MKQVNVSELSGAALDYAVAVCENEPVRRSRQGGWLDCANMVYSPSSDWCEAGPIIERERIDIAPSYESKDWFAWIEQRYDFRGSTLLQAAMRCYVASKLGTTVEIPEELL